MKYQLLITLLLFVATSYAQKGVVINEVMQSNIDYMMVDGDFPDSWVELYNTTGTDIDISGWYIGENADSKRAWRLPERLTVPAYGHFVIYCDKDAAGVHTDFRLDAGNAQLYLMDAGATVVDHLQMAEMPAPNIAYGRVSDGADRWHYELTPTAGAANNGGGADTVLPEPIFSIAGGLYSNDVHVTLTMPDGMPEGTLIYYTTDGTEPTSESTCAREVQMDIMSSTVLRAKLIDAGNTALSRRSTTQSYIYHPRAVTMPVISIVSDPDYFYSGEIGILSSTVNGGKPNYMQSWRRPVNVEYYAPGCASATFNQLGETAVSGVSTREQAQKSMKIYSNKRFGKKKFKGDFWVDKSEVTKVKSFVIRSGGNNAFGGRINDAVVQTLFGTHATNMDWQAYTPVVVYLNGAYLGEFGMRERSNDDYVEANYDGLEDVEMADETSYQTPTPGSLYSEFYAAYVNGSPTYSQMCDMMDMDNFIQTLCAEIYGMNTDFPTNNVSMWRPTAEGGKWRWILKDMDRFGMDFMLYPPSFDMFQYLFNPDEMMFGGMHHFDLYGRLSRYPEFVQQFVGTFAVYLGDFLRPDYVTALVDSFDCAIMDELQATFSLYNQSYSEHDSSIQFLKEIIANRSSLIYSQMGEYFGLGYAVPMSVSPCGDPNVTLNGVPLTTGAFDGAYYRGVPLTLSADNRVWQWEMVITHAMGAKDTVTLDGRTVTLRLSDYISSYNDSVTIRAIVSDAPETPDDDEPEVDPTPDDDEPEVGPIPDIASL